MISVQPLPSGIANFLFSIFPFSSLSIKQSTYPWPWTWQYINTWKCNSIQKNKNECTVIPQALSCPDGEQLQIRMTVILCFTLYSPCKTMQNPIWHANLQIFTKVIASTSTTQTCYAWKNASLHDHAKALTLSICSKCADGLTTWTKRKNEYWVPCWQRAKHSLSIFISQNQIYQQHFFLNKALLVCILSAFSCKLWSEH